MDERPLTEADLPGALALSAEAGWNQKADDWRLILRLGRARGRLDAGRLIASAAILPHGGRIGWICMVLVARPARRRGHATALMRWAMDEARAAGMIAGLDATPEGRAVYSRLGFTDAWSLTRWQGIPRPAPAAPLPAGLRPCTSADLPAIARLDGAALGADRAPLIAALHDRCPDLAHVATRGDTVTGFALARDGGLATQIGPVLADDPATARALIDAALDLCPGPVLIDLADDRAQLAAHLSDRGLAPRRRFTRMFRDAAVPPGDPARIAAVAGPELG